MIPIKNQKPTKIGNSHYFLIPAQYINNGAINTKASFNLDVNETI
jgi:hypothetical protein